jgi:hypothetical protein
MNLIGKKTLETKNFHCSLFVIIEGKRKEKKRQGTRLKHLLDEVKGRNKVIELESESTGSHSLENWLLKKLMNLSQNGLPNEPINCIAKSSWIICNWHVEAASPSDMWVGLVICQSIEFCTSEESNRRHHRCNKQKLRANTCPFRVSNFCRPSCVQPLNVQNCSGH